MAVRDSSLGLRRYAEPARLLDDASSEYIRTSGASMASWPLTVALWCRADAIGNDNRVLMIHDGISKYISLWILTVFPRVYFSLCDGATTVTPFTSTDFTTGSWHHLAGVSSANNSRAVYLDGGAKGSNVTAINTFTATIPALGRDDLGAANYWSGEVFQPVVWNVALADAEIMALANGYPPWRMRPAAIVSEINLRSLYDTRLRTVWTPSGNRPSVPPRVWPAQRRAWRKPSIARQVIQAYRRTG